MAPVKPSSRSVSAALAPARLAPMITYAGSSGIVTPQVLAREGDPPGTPRHSAGSAGHAFGAPRAGTHRHSRPCQATADVSVSEAT